MNISSVKTLNLELTSRCTAKCPFCVRVQTNFTDIVDIEWETLMKIPYQNLRRVSLTGSVGEPTCHPEILNLVKHMRKNAPEMVIKMTTNGFTHSEEWWYNFGKYFNDNCPGYAIFGVDGLEDTHSLYRKGTDFNQITKNIKAFNEAGGDSLLQFIIFKHNEHQLADIKQLGKDLGCVRSFYRPSKEYNDELQRPEKHIRTQTDIVREGGHVHCFILERDELFLNMDGFITPCYLLNFNRDLYKNESSEFIEKYEEIIPLLDLNKYTYNEIVEQPIFDYVISMKDKLNTCNMVCRCSIQELVNWL